MLLYGAEKILLKKGRVFAGQSNMSRLSLVFVERKSFRGHWSQWMETRRWTSRFLSVWWKYKQPIRARFLKNLHLHVGLNKV